MMPSSNRACQYASYAYLDPQKERGFECGISRHRKCWTSALMGSLFGTGKTKLINCPPRPRSSGTR